LGFTTHNPLRQEAAVTSPPPLRRQSTAVVVRYYLPRSGFVQDAANRAIREQGGHFIGAGGEGVGWSCGQMHIQTYLLRLPEHILTLRT